ncbi:DUF4214 domain-containing protein [Sulfitobacter sp. R18_1]|uniref:DUF4214 domain-containing protein n=1 Tax=Sulfitobacter sp. R18_1 TaxID=2821104 RepID=UPI001ADD4D0C|nr:DUF4214 domain-containing protein [Sulfitobacter sp. R18_1]MBO9431599.1 DUF4214 domain-containing protein [Sulfitobacter sp. R18_1]
MNALDAFRLMFGTEPTSTQRRQANDYGGLHNPAVIDGLGAQADRLLDQIEAQCGIRFQRPVVAGLVELREDVTPRTDDYVLRSCFGREVAAQLLAADVPRQDDLAAMYRAVLQREPDDGGYTYYRGKLDRGEMTLGALCDELYYNRDDDFERRGLTVPTNY